jgi:hypothetical protein
MTVPVQSTIGYSQNDPQGKTFSIINSETGKSIGHCEPDLSENSAKVDRVFIGDSQIKGKKLCKEITTLLLDYGLNILHQPFIELNGF